MERFGGAMLEAPEDLHALTRTGVLPVPRRHAGRASHASSYVAPPPAAADEQHTQLRRTAVPVLPAPQPSPSGYGLDLGAAAGPWLVTHVRRRVANVAVGHGASPDESLVVELLTSELVTNAVVHGPDEAHVGVRTAYRDGAFSVAVTDQGAGLPVLRDPHPTEPSGRGLHVVANLASAWGIDPGTAGTTVWFTVELARGVERGSRHG